MAIAKTKNHNQTEIDVLDELEEIIASAETLYGASGTRAEIRAYLDEGPVLELTDQNDQIYARIRASLNPKVARLFTSSVPKNRPMSVKDRAELRLQYLEPYIDIEAAVEVTTNHVRELKEQITKTELMTAVFEMTPVLLCCADSHLEMGPGMESIRVMDRTTGVEMRPVHAEGVTMDSIAELNIGVRTDGTVDRQALLAAIHEVSANRTVPFSD